MATELKHTVYIVRHGQCESNVNGMTLRGEDDIITDFGREQARRLGERLKDVKFTKIYSSPFPRAFETAKEFISCLPSQNNLSVTPDDRLKERDMGALVGRDLNETGMYILNELKRGIKFNDIELPDAENQPQFVQRIKGFFQDLLGYLNSSKEPQTVLIVSHNIWMARFFVGFNDSTYDDICQSKNWNQKLACLISNENTSITTFTVDFPPESKTLVTFDIILDAKHLQGLQKPVTKTPITHNEDKKRFLKEMQAIPGAAKDMGCSPV